MPPLKTKKRIVAALTIAGVLLAAGLYALAQQPYQLTPLEESKRDRAVSASASGARTRGRSPDALLSTSISGGMRRSP